MTTTASQLVHFKDGTPAAPGGKTNVKWQIGAPYPDTVIVNGISVAVEAQDISAYTNSAPSFADSETPSGTIDGSNKTFTLANAPSPALSLILVLSPNGSGGGVVLIQGVDYIISSFLDLVLTNAPATGDTLTAWYRY